MRWSPKPENGGQYLGGVPNAHNRKDVVMTVKELIEQLNQFDQDAKVKV